MEHELGPEPDSTNVTLTLRLLSSTKPSTENIREKWQEHHFDDLSAQKKENNYILIFSK